MKLIGSPVSYRCLACCMVLDACDIKYDFVSQRDISEEEYKKANPQKKVPVLLTPEGPVYETTAIIKHVARLSGKLGGKDLYEKALIDQWLSWANSEIACTLTTFYYQTCGFLKSELSYKTEDITKGRESFQQKLTILNDHLKGKKFVVGDTLTVADLAILSFIYQAFAFCLSDSARNKFKNIIKWIEEFSKTNSQFKKFFGRIRYVSQPLKTVEGPATEKKQAKPKEEKKEKKVEEAPKPAEPPKPTFPDTQLNLMDFKTFFVNEKDLDQAMSKFWEQFKEGEWSLWHLKYIKYPGECEVVYRTNNLLRTFMSRLEHVRKFIFGTHFVLGDEPALFIEGVWLIRGPELFNDIKEIDVFDTYEWIKLDSSKPETKELVKDFWTHRVEEDMKVQDKVIRTFKWIK